MILGRPIFEESLMLQWLALQVEPLRTAYATWHDHDSWNKYAESLTQARDEVPPESIEPLITHAKSRRDIAKAFANENHLRRVKFPSSNDLARKHLHRAGECLPFALSQQFVHGRALPASNRQRHSASGGMVIGNRPEHQAALLPVVVQWTSASILHSYFAVAEVLRWTVPVDITRLQTLMRTI